MDRSFHRSLTIPTICGILLFALLALWMLWIKSALIGMLLMLTVVSMTERVMNTRYTFTEDKDGPLLVINNGRFAREKKIRINEIIDCRSMKVSFGLSSFLLIDYGMNQTIGIQPREADIFINELKKRQDNIIS